MKPPKKWFDEADTKPKSTQGVKGDSFRSYMVLKIKRQEEQFGLQIPPTPDSIQEKQKFVKFQDENFSKEGENENEEPKTMNTLVLNLQNKRRKSGAKAKLERRRRHVSKEKIKEMECINSTHSYQNPDFVDSAKVEVEKNFSNQKAPTKSLRKRLRPDLFFQGVTIMVNGFTTGIDDETLKRIIHKHGGNFVKYEMSSVTHIIAESLSEAKAKIYKNRRNPIPVVKPEWILDSVKKGYCLPHADYLLEQVRDANSQPSLTGYFKNTQSSLKPMNHETETTSEGIGSTKSSSSVDSKQPIRSPSVGSPIAKSPTKIRRWSPNDGPRTTGNDPNFLKDYFANSRLSFIGSHKQRNQNDYRHRVAMKSPNARRVVFHIDMDCFFANVVIRRFPQYREYPVAVGHVQRIPPFQNSDDKKDSNSELSTCNYIARRYGVRKGMFLSRALSLCPNLVVLPYDFNAYEEVTESVAHILDRYVEDYHGALEQVSCDESYCEFYFDSGDEIVKEIVTNILQEIKLQTKCTASIGIGPNKLLAKLATNKVKANDGDGFHIAGHWNDFLKGLELKEIPGIGWKLAKILNEQNLYTVDDVWDISESDLCKIIGDGTGKKIFNFCQGKDDREVKPIERKTVSAECNYGVRFENGQYGVDYMITGLAEEVEKRMEHLDVYGRHLTLKVKERRPGAPPPGKFNGHGLCNDHSKSISLPGPNATRDSKIIASEAMKLYTNLGLNKTDVRGMGITISKLEGMDSKTTQVSTAMSAWLKSGVRNQNEQDECFEKNDSSIYNMSLNQSKSVDESVSYQSNGESVLINLSDDFQDSLTNDRNGTQVESDEALAKRLAAEWELEDKAGSNKPRKKRVTRNRTRPKDPNQSTLKFESHHLPSQKEVIPETQILNVTNVICDEKTQMILKSFDRNEDMTFLNEWMIINPDPSNDEVEMMGEYLCHCIEAFRTEDAIFFLRCIKHRNDKWGNDHYTSILLFVQQWLCKHRGTKLDEGWHGL